MDGVVLGDGEEEVKLLLDVVNWVLGEDKVGWGAGWLGLVNLWLLGELDQLLDGVLLVEGLIGELLGTGCPVSNRKGYWEVVDLLSNRVADVDVVEEDIILHGPDLETDGSHWLQVGGVLVLEVVWVLDLARSPNTLVGWVVYVWCAVKVSSGRMGRNFQILTSTCPCTLGS